ncbi:GNAT family N-acetyltransferase [Photobacterium ganghwense]|uniref:Acyltransferase n=2 Tax=Photobacterium ganghwense TaxID=320778 RepID=A0A0J1GZB3_9GAMM|nr:GNAT family N-acetyltransferase [Photobacterium ganghwense]KLV04991.1 acyltransferase [Photobacterium ganghwense]MBV1843469.1 GNAT family N-acetyltransferase [Photobacterium ganghwense]PSU04777.1 GNAT family N-acetyltransferase [Photobacterium ganghwense]QSV13966.1 GNAT family N-acetyltransferase [Photobacterium ganghwense]
MNKLRFHPIEPLRFPLINRLYKQHYPAGKAKKDEVIWIGEDNSAIHCCVRFKQFDGFQLMTGMLVIPDARGQKQGQQLLVAAQSQLEQAPCFCFAFSYLVDFYQATGFVPVPESELPESLQSRLTRYRLSGKSLVAMIYQQAVTQ